MIRGEERLRLRHLVVPMVCLLVATYFAYHAVYGSHGLLAWMDQADEISALKVDLEAAQTQRQRLEHHVTLLRPESLDPDLLDERARATLGYARPDEITIYREGE